MSDTRLQAVLLMGPTASGKTAAALHLARQSPIEIISVDSALVFRDMNIGTAKPDEEELAQCPHHLIDIITPEEAYSAARFCSDAQRLIGEICARGQLPVLAGGTMLYFKALLEGLSDLPQADAALRQEIEEHAARAGWPALHAELARLDAAAASRLNPNDAQRIQRALEVVRLTGRPLAESYAQRESTSPAIDYLPLALQPAERSVLHTRIAQRFDAMLDEGFEEEVRQLRTRYRLDIEMTSMRCVGYRQMWEYLDGEVDAATMREKGIAATRQLAKRQITWLRQFRENWSGYQEFDSLDAQHLAQLEAALSAWRET
ncbi:tRNA (adenosine(37)-N6)-dimethylallyltransferase MiaA [Uliginosibacterium aquaticum]|uniref:tRNA dimethylallyltransferase n=1 Tax=Uliginosibacterium aquaticum TaxID=2731212 RepID=A0ABX2IIV9_9RHOO|nr:tRNA (adenosine(37)-N6)-dimethylallyltransferase MiaA [Uliginosibacterium aquaticum]NSL56763.1 tRNA (adenosine(37)-N6)-dimethylallyltransferase MiaA [Uliginosibacterium aquaticum]